MWPNMFTHLCPLRRPDSSEGSCCNDPLSSSAMTSPFPRPGLRATEKGHVDHTGTGLRFYADSACLLTGSRCWTCWQSNVMRPIRAHPLLGILGVGVPIESVLESDRERPAGTRGGCADLEQN
jgi:hypothetical protein